MKTIIPILLFLFSTALFSHSYVLGQTPTPTPLKRSTSINTATPATSKASAAQDGNRKAQPSIQNAKLILPDLVIKQIKLLPGSGLNPKRGMKVLIANVGSADASTAFYLRLVIKRASTPSKNGQSTYDGKDEQWAVTTQPLAMGAARWVNFEALKILNDGSTNEIYSVTASVDVAVTTITSMSIWPPKQTSKTEGPFVKESNENNNTLSPDPNTIAP